MKKDFTSKQLLELLKDKSSPFYYAMQDRSCRKVKGKNLMRVFANDDIYFLKAEQECELRKRIKSSK